MRDLHMLKTQVINNHACILWIIKRKAGDEVSMSMALSVSPCQEHRLYDANTFNKMLAKGMNLKCNN